MNIEFYFIFEFNIFGVVKTFFDTRFQSDVFYFSSSSSSN